MFSCPLVQHTPEVNKVRSFLTELCPSGGLHSEIKAIPSIRDPAIKKSVCLFGFSAAQATLSGVRRARLWPASGRRKRHRRATVCKHHSALPSLPCRPTSEPCSPLNSDVPFCYAHLRISCSFKSLLKAMSTACICVCSPDLNDSRSHCTGHKACTTECVQKAPTRTLGQYVKMGHDHFLSYT